MADNTVKITLKVSSDGSAADELKTAKQIEATYSKINKQAGTAGSRAVASKAAPGLSGQDYGTARGTVGTGAGARDFAKESQGLGGLVRLYAVWAANIFAASAAFSALSNAANTTNMIEGMNQLGISSGIALGSMAKRFVEASQGAISLKDAMSATVKATSAGLSQAQFTQLGEVASKASKALGVDMSDAVSRLTRGITKLEPELLDELGLFTKVGTASEDYAKRIGKSVTSLTDFEKRQAYANAVLKEGITKFGDIKVDANPYDQLAASLSNLSTKVLGTLNIALGPLISLLSSSPTALTAAVGGLGVMLLKQAIPAIGQYKSSLATAADEAEKKWQLKSDAIKKIEKDQFQYITNMSEATADAKLASFEKAEQRLKKSKAGAGAFDERTQGILSTGTLGKEDKAYLKGKAAEAEAAGNKQLAAAYTEARVSLDKWIKSEIEHDKLLKQINLQTNQNIASASKYSAAGFARDELAKAKEAKAKTGLISKASEDASTGSMGAAWSKLKIGVAEEGLTGLSKGLTTAGGAAAIATTAFTRVLSVVSGFLGWVGIAVGVLTTLYSAVSSNAKEADALSSAIDMAEESAKTATGTFAKFNNELSAQSLMAKSNAMAGLAESVDEVIKKFLEFDKASNIIDDIWEKLKGIVGLSKQDDVSKALSGNIMKMLDNLDSPELKKTAEDKLKKLLSITKVDFKSLDDAIESIDPKKLKLIPGIMEEIRVKSQATSSAVSQIMEGFKGVTTTFVALENTLKSSDPLSNFANAIAKQSVVMNSAFKDPLVAAVTFQEVLKDTSKLNAFPPEAAAQILAAADHYKALSSSIEESKGAIKVLDDELTKGAGVWTSIFTQRKAELNVKIKADNASIIELGKVMQTAAASSLDYAYRISLQKFKAASAQATIDQQKSLVGMLPKSENTIKVQMDLENRSIDIRKQEIQAIFLLVQEMKITRTSGKIQSLTSRIDAITPEADLADKGVRKESLNTELKLAQGEMSVYKDKNLAKNAASLPLELKGLAFEELAIQKGFMSQMKALDMSKLTNEQKFKVENSIALQDKANVDNANYLKEQATLHSNILSSTNYESKTLEERAKIETEYLAQTKEARLKVATEADRKNVNITEAVLSVAGAGSDAGKAAVTDLPRYKQQLIDAEARFTIEEDTNKALAKRGLLVSTTNREYDRQDTIIQQILDASTLTYEADKQRIDGSQTLLDIKQNLNLITVDDYDKQTRLNKLASIELDIAQQLVVARMDYNKKVIPLNREEAAGGVTPARKVEIDTDRAKALAYYTDSKIKVEDLGVSKQKDVELTYSMSEKTKALNESFASSMDNMSNALVDFAFTGKQTFGDMIKSMILDLAKLELRMSLSNSLKAAGGLSGIASTVAGFFTGGSGVGISAGGPTGADMDAFYTQAKGGAWDSGIQKFAKGSAFSNSIVNSPTLFKFAKGTGMMGEAGPEAIMPLKRDANGNLGVRGGDSGGEVNVTVNNYSTAPATTKETKDSRGNRRIEVTIGDMVAGEIGRAGSAAQGSIRNTFGQKPQLLRR